MVCKFLLQKRIWFVMLLKKMNLCCSWANLTSKYLDSWLCLHTIRIRCKFLCIVKYLIGKLSKQKSSWKNDDPRRRKENLR